MRLCGKMSIWIDDKNVNFMAEIFMSAVFMDVMAEFNFSIPFTHERPSRVCNQRQRNSLSTLSIDSIESAV